MPRRRRRQQQQQPLSLLWRSKNSFNSTTCNCKMLSEDARTQPTYKKGLRGTVDRCCYCRGCFEAYPSFRARAHDDTDVTRPNGITCSTFFCLVSPTPASETSVKLKKIIIIMTIVEFLYAEHRSRCNRENCKPAPSSRIRNSISFILGAPGSSVGEKDL